MGMDLGNRMYLKRLSRWAAVTGRPLLVGADLQASPLEVHYSGVLNKLDAPAELISPSNGRGTCRHSTGSWRFIDGFVASRELAAGVDVEIKL